MRIVGFLTQAGNLIHGLVNLRQIPRQEISILRGMNGNNDGFDGFAREPVRRLSVERIDFGSILSVGIDPINHLNDENVNVNVYAELAKLKAENCRLKRELEEKCQLIDEMNSEMERDDYDKLLCMIVEIYRRMKIEIGQQLVNDGVIKDGVKLDGYLEAVRRGSVSGDGWPKEESIQWMAEFENSPEMRALRDFRNRISHTTCTDLPILEQWKTRLLRETLKHSKNDKSVDSLMAEAALSILRKATVRFGRNSPKMLERKRVKYDTIEAVEVENKSSSSGSGTLMKKQSQGLLEQAEHDNEINDFDELISSGAMSEKQRKLVAKLVRKKTEKRSNPDWSARNNRVVVKGEEAASKSPVKTVSVVEEVRVRNAGILKPTDPFDLFHSNSNLIGELRKMKNKSSQTFAEIRKLRAENKALIGKYGEQAMKRERGPNSSKKRRKSE